MPEGFYWVSYNKGGITTYAVIQVDANGKVQFPGIEEPCQRFLRSMKFLSYTPLVRPED